MLILFSPIRECVTSGHEIVHEKTTRLEKWLGGWSAIKRGRNPLCIRGAARDTPTLLSRDRLINFKSFLSRAKSFSFPFVSRLLATPRSCYAPPSVICRGRDYTALFFGPLPTPLFFMLLTIRWTAIISESISSSAGLNSRMIMVWIDDWSGDISAEAILSTNIYYYNSTCTYILHNDSMYYIILYRAIT